MLEIKTFPIGPLQTNCYIVHTDKEAVAVDPGGDPRPVLDWLQKKGLVLTHILCTHLHFDHTYGINAAQQATGALVLASPEDEFLLQKADGKGGVWGCPLVPEYSFTPLQAGELPLLGTTCQVLATPGHTPGGLSFYFPEIHSILVGDVLFYRSVGRTDFDGGSLEDLMHSIGKCLMSLPDATLVYPGHNRHTSIGDERLNNPFVSDFAV